MQQHDVTTLLSHARKAATLIQGFVAERTWDDYRADELVRSAVERQFQIVARPSGTSRCTDTRWLTTASFGKPPPAGSSL